MANVSPSVYKELLLEIIKADCTGCGLIIKCADQDMLLLKRGLVHAKHKLKAAGDLTYANHCVEVEHHTDAGHVVCYLRLKNFAKPKPVKHVPSIEDM